MQIEITEKALDKLRTINNDNFKYLWLFYDTDDCGCGVNGVLTLRLTNSMDDYFKQVENDSHPVIIHKQQATFFANEMKLDYIGNGFRLSGPEGILNPLISEQELLKGDNNE